jgi:hypothetical protein
MLSLILMVTCVSPAAGFRSSCIAVVVVGVLHFTVHSLSWVYDNFLPLAVAAICWSYLLAVFIFAKSFKKGAVLADGGDTGDVRGVPGPSAIVVGGLPIGRRHCLPRPAL